MAPAARSAATAKASVAASSGNRWVMIVPGELRPGGQEGGGHVDVA